MNQHLLYKWSHEHLISVLASGKNRILRDPLLINAFKKVRRADFVPDSLRDLAYEDKDLEIGYGEIISKPTLVAKLLDILRPASGKKILEIGAGSGYITAILGLIAGESGQVFALERNQLLAEYARSNLEKYPEIKSVQIIFRDGNNGLAEKAPYDYIYCEISFDEIPQTLKNQLTVGGRLVCAKTDQSIVLVERISPTEFDETAYDGYILEPVKIGVE